MAIEQAESHLHQSGTQHGVIASAAQEAWHPDALSTGRNGQRNEPHVLDFGAASDIYANKEKFEQPSANARIFGLRPVDENLMTDVSDSLINLTDAPQDVYVISAHGTPGMLHMTGKDVNDAKDEIPVGDLVPTTQANARDHRLTVLKACHSADTNGGAFYLPTAGDLAKQAGGYVLGYEGEAEKSSIYIPGMNRHADLFGPDGKVVARFDLPMTKEEWDFAKQYAKTGKAPTLVPPGVTLGDKEYWKNQNTIPQST
jgi:hypothetical protein